MVGGGGGGGVGGGGSTNVAKMMFCTLTFDLFTARSSLLLYAFVWALYICMEKMVIISNDLPLKPLGQCCSNFMWNLLGAGEQKIAKMVMVHSNMAAMPIYGKNH